MAKHTDEADRLLAELARQQERARRDPRIGQLVKAARRGDLRSVKRLLDEGADPQAPAFEDGMMETPVWAAMYGKSPEAIRLLAAAGADLNDGFPHTPLGIAANWGNLELLHALIAGKADVNLANRSHETPLLRAVLESNTEIVAALLKAGADPHLVVKKEKWDTVTNYSPIELATLTRKKRIIELFAASGAANLAPPAMLLCSAAGAGDLPAVKRKIEVEGVDIHSRDPQGTTPLICAAVEGRTRVVKYLIERGADVNLAGGGQSPLFAAAMSGKVEVVKLLVEAGADLDYSIRPTPRGRKYTVLDAAKEERFSKVVAYLLEEQKQRGGKVVKTPPPTAPTGVPTFNTNDAAIVVEAPVDRSAETFAAMIKGKVMAIDALGSKVKLTSRCYAVFKLAGQPWSAVMKLNCKEFKHWPSLGDAQELSKSIKTRALFVANSDTGGVTQYALFEKGELIEFFDYGTADDKTSLASAFKRVKNAYGLDLSILKHSAVAEGKTFASSQRSLNVKKVKNDLDYVNDYVMKQNAFIPFFVDEWGKAGQQIELSLEGLGPDDIERLDYVAV